MAPFYTEPPTVILQGYILTPEVEKNVLGSIAEQPETVPHANFLESYMENLPRTTTLLVSCAASADSQYVSSMVSSIVQRFRFFLCPLYDEPKFARDSKINTHSED